MSVATRQMSKYLSPAKINWFLHITGRRADGYHFLETVFQQIDWYDELNIVPRHDASVVVRGDLSGVAMTDNLAYRAAVALKSHVQNDALGAEITLTKNIPTGAGLGGGSSNAATVLCALNELWQLHLNNADLQRIGLSLGADVPFFVSGHRAAFASGVGEILTPLDLPSRTLLLINPKTHVSTAAVFNHPDLKRNHAPLDAANIESLIKHFNPASTELHNDLEGATFALSEPTRRVYQYLKAIAPDATIRMSGSGATVFAAPNHEASHQNLLNCQHNLPEDWQSRMVLSL